MKILATAVFLASVLCAQTAETIPYRALMAARNETSPVVDANATGGVTIWLHVVRDAAGKVTSGSIDFGVSYKMSGATTFTAMHIHKAPAGVAGAIVVPVPLTRFDDAGGVGAMDVRQVQFSSADLSTGVYDAVNGILDDPSQFYFNVHTADAPAGAMRGQLQRADMTVLMGMMSPANETPPVQGINASAVATVVALRTSNPPTAAVIFDINYTGFPSDTTFTGLHIHYGNVGVAGPVTIDSGISARNTVAVGQGGAGNFHYEFEADLARSLAPETVTGLFDRPETTYINLHTTASPGGVIRAQLHRADHAFIRVTATPAEEVATPPVSIVASAPSVIHFYALRNPDGTIPAGAVIFDINPRFPAGTTITAMHIHDAVAGVNGPVTIDAKLPAFPLLTDQGTGNVTRVVSVSAPAALSSLNDLVQNPEKHYFNMHTSVYPGGAIRAQLAGAPAAPLVTAAISSVSDIARTTAAPKSLMSVYGLRLGKVFANLDGFLQLDSLPKTLNGTSVTVGGTPAGMVMVATDQVIIEVPAEATEGTQPVVVTSASGASNTFSMPVRATSPNIFFDSVGGILTKTNFTLVRPETPAVAGEVLLIFSTGNGQTTPALNTGRVPPSNQLFNAQTPTVSIGGQSAEVIYSVASPGFPGLYQTAVRMPAGVPAGRAAVLMTVGGVSSNTVNINVR